MRRPFIAGNWKMHGSRAQNAELIEALLLGLPAQTTVDIAVCPPSVYLWEVGKLLKASNVALGAQTVCAEALGAFTGEVCAAMLKDVGDRKSTRLNSSHLVISYAVFCLKKKRRGNKM